MAIVALQVGQCHSFSEAVNIKLLLPAVTEGKKHAQLHKAVLAAVN